MTDATNLQILICIVRGWKRTGIIIIAHTQNNMSQCSGACFHYGAVSSDQCFRTNSNYNDSYCRCFRPSVYISSKDLHRLGYISNEWVINFRNIFWCSLTDQSARVRDCKKISLLYSIVHAWVATERPSARRLYILVCSNQGICCTFSLSADFTPSARHENRNPRLGPCLVLLRVLSQLIFHVRLVTEDGGGAPVDDLINEYLDQMKMKDKIDGELIHGSYVQACVFNIGG